MLAVEQSPGFEQTRQVVAEILLVRRFQVAPDSIQIHVRQAELRHGLLVVEQGFRSLEQPEQLFSTRAAAPSSRSHVVASVIGGPLVPLRDIHNHHLLALEVNNLGENSYRRLAQVEGDIIHLQHYRVRIRHARDNPIVFYPDEDLTA
jgi:hypothetical protein